MDLTMRVRMGIWRAVLSNRESYKEEPNYSFVSVGKVEILRMFFPKRQSPLPSLLCQGNHQNNLML
jgi:hypothetical protein